MVGIYRKIGYKINVTKLYIECEHGHQTTSQAEFPKFMDGIILLSIMMLSEAAKLGAGVTEESHYLGEYQYSGITGL
jgi:hypothetical protein